MATAQEVAHIVTGLMTLCGAVALCAFIIRRPNFKGRLRLALGLLTAGLITFSAFNFALVAGGTGTTGAVVSVAAVIGSAAATLGSVMLAHIAFQSPLISALHHRVEAHRRTLARLRRSRDDLDRRVKERTREVHEQEKRLRIALRDSNISVFMQDADLRYVWMRNAPEGYDATEFIGKTDEEILPPAAARAATAAKKKVIETGEDYTTELCLKPSETSGPIRYFDVTTEPYYDEAGELEGLLSVSVETTEKRHREELLKSTLLEVSHRTKNQLAVLMSIARRLAESKLDTAKFLPAFEARMRALSICQDVLVEYDWSAPPLERIVRAQLEPYLSRLPSRASTLVINGPEVKIKPTAVQNIGLVLHELALNAFEVGVLSSSAGKIDISWDLQERVGSIEGNNAKRLVFLWSESRSTNSAKEELESKFGRTMADKIARSALDGCLEIDQTESGINARLEVGASLIAN